MDRAHYNTYQDKDLVALIKGDDEQAFRELYQRYYPVLYIHAFKRIADTELIEDFLQDVFASFWKNRTTITISYSVSAYLYSAVRYKITNHFLQQKTANKYLDSLQDYLDAAEPIETDFLIRHKELSEIIETEINALPPAMRRIFIMSRFEQMPHREIASTLQLSELTVRTQIKKALRILRNKLPLIIYILLS